MADGTAIWWIRRDLRLTDNPALYAALENSSFVLPVFILDPALMQLQYAAPQRKAFLLASLQSLERDLRARGSQLVLRSGDPLQVLQSILAETGAYGVYAAADYSPYARRRDARVQEYLPLHLSDGLAVHAPGDVLKKDGSPYTVFTPYMSAWLERALPAWQNLLPAPENINTPPSIASESFPIIDFQHERTFPPGEAAARERLAAFTGGNNAPVFAYHQLRDLPGSDGTSCLSPYLRFGLISAREAVLTALDASQRAAQWETHLTTDKSAGHPPGSVARQGIDTWLSELIWRDFYNSILFHFPHVRQGSYRPEFRDIRWRNDPHEYAAWQEGRTGYPIVDAAMRQLQQTGWMHNRARMIAASFLVKNLLVDWQWGERWFMQHLLDGDPAANNGGWQWAAGTGASAAPYFRIFNPVVQGQRFDPQGVYIRRWLPELADVPDRYLHTPWQMTEEVQAQSRCVIGRTYPKPVVELAMSRRRALEAYAQSRDFYISKK